MKKHIIWGLALLLFLIILLGGCFHYNRNAPGESMAGLGPIFATVVSLVGGALGWAYHKVGKRHEQRSSALERGLLTLCIVITIIIPISSLYDFGLQDALREH